MKMVIAAITAALLVGCSPDEKDPIASTKVNDLDELAVANTSILACRSLKDAHAFYAEKVNDLTGGRLSLMATMDGRTCLLIAQGSKLHITASVKLEDRTYFRMEAPIGRPWQWWAPQLWN
jgi:hypothetical protein